MAPKYMLEHFMEAELLVNITEHEVQCIINVVLMFNCSTSKGAILFVFKSTHRYTFSSLDLYPTKVLL